MELKKAFGKVFRWFRKERAISQDDLSEVSGRTYISSLERGMYSPTIEKLDALAPMLNIHPITLLVCTYAEREGVSTELLLKRVQEEINLSEAPWKISNSQ
ncbi:MAG: helix-turn-helix domain-containing protein [Pseudomonas sp.]|uniref:helix-turn-helix domain-containing protein n=1 Tax=Pseudomonas TaxID=286 RepID=UPI0005A509F2|nr:helix-turn-helix transcriptional regulator [Pseudomonas sp. VLB120]